jgi:DNA-binding IclR family transcriptional regulator
MRDAELLETIGDTKRYRPGSLLINAAASYRYSSGLIERAHDVVARASKATGHTGYVSKLIGNEVVAVTDHPGSHTLRVVSGVGRRLTAHATATGRALLALKSDAEVRALFPDEIVPPSSRAPQSVDELLERLAEVRKRKASFSNQESTPGVNAVATAVRDAETGEAVALCIVYPAARGPDADRTKIETMLLEGAAEIADVLVSM